MIAQIPSVSQLSDVNSTDWAYQALQLLVEQYGCIAGYADGTFRGNRTLRRYEFAAAMNACLPRLQSQQLLIADLETIRRLQDEFQTELPTLQSRVDGTGLLRRDEVELYTEHVKCFCDNELPLL